MTKMMSCEISDQVSIDDFGGIDLPSMFQSLPSVRKEKQELPADFSPHAYTVILGRGKISENVGNRRLKVVVDMELRNYQQAPTRREKSFVVARVLDTFQSACAVGAFVRCENGSWYEVPDSEAREKISTMFRDQLSHQYKSSTPNKVKRRRQRKAFKKQTSLSSMKKPFSFVNMDITRLQAELDAVESAAISYPECNSMISV
jgi:hypothetical protein